MEPKELANKLRNVSPVLAQNLIAVGFDEPAKLCKFDATVPYRKIFVENSLGCGKFNAAYLYALEGAILDCDWRDIPKIKKQEFKQFTKALRQGKCQI